MVGLSVKLVERDGDVSHGKCATGRCTFRRAESKRWVPIRQSTFSVSAGSLWRPSRGPLSCVLHGVVACTFLCRFPILWDATGVITAAQILRVRRGH